MDIEIIRGIATILTVICFVLSAKEWKQRYYRKSARAGWLVITMSAIVLLSVLTVFSRSMLDVLIAVLTYLWLVAAAVWLGKLLWYRRLKA